MRVDVSRHDAPTHILVGGSASDSLDVAQLPVLRAAMARLARLSAAIAWVNPLLETPRDEPRGAPDLVVEVLSPSTREYDRQTKIGWYQQYGVLECWLVDPDSRSIDAITCSPPPVRRVTFNGDEIVRSKVFPDWGSKPITISGRLP